MLNDPRDTKGPFRHGYRLRLSGWTPDRETVLWWMGTAHEDRIAESLEREIKARSENVPADSAEYWRLVAEVAVEHLSHDMLALAKKWGTDFTDMNWGSSRRS